jgi:hypothetical protein
MWLKFPDIRRPHASKHASLYLAFCSLARLAVILIGVTIYVLSAR